MASYGRKSAASRLAIVAAIPGGGRPEPPKQLDAVERRIWRELVGALPPYWIDAAGEQILRRLVCQCAISERREARLRELRQQHPDEDDEISAALEASHRATAKSVGHLLNLLRATPRSRIVSRAAGPKLEGVAQVKPWNVRARSSAPTT